MPIAKSPPPPNSSGVLIPQGFSAGEDLVKGSAVALVDVGGVKQLLLCTASQYGYSFIGFAASVVASGNSGTLVTGRGSVVTPVVEGGVDLVENQPVFLSDTPGEVTQTPPGGGSRYVLRVGMAVSTTQIVLTSDYAVYTPA